MLRVEVGLSDEYTIGSSLALGVAVGLNNEKGL